jgi:hypothetical protein
LVKGTAAGTRRARWRELLANGVDGRREGVFQLDVSWNCKEEKNKTKILL